MKNLHILKAVLLAMTVGLFAGNAEAASVQFYAAANCDCTITTPGTGDPITLSQSVNDLEYSGLIRIHDSPADYSSTHANDVTGYAFKGWYTRKSGWTGQETPQVADCTDLITTSADLTYSQITAEAGREPNVPLVFAKYVRVYEITAKVSPSGSGTVSVSPAQGPYEEGSTVTLSATESNAAYKLAHWKKGNSKVSDSDGKLSLQITATADAAYTALFTNRIYTVTFKDPSGTYPDDVQTVTHGESATAPTWSRSGYSLAWDKGFSSITADTAVNAQWTGNTYTVTFDKNGGNTPSQATQSVTYGSTYGTLATCSRTGYTFNGWYTEKSGGSEVTADTKVQITAAQTLYAHWTPVSYTITYTGLKTGVTNPNPTTYTIETSTITFAPPTAVVGYAFNGWSPVSIPKGSTGNKTVTASYLETVDKPIITPTLTYNGSQQACATTDSRVQASNNQKTVPGKYTATFLPKSGYCWSDGTAEPYVVEWQIVNAEIVVNEIRQSDSLTYTGEPLTPEVYARVTVKGSQTVTWKYSKTPDSYAATMPSFTDAGTHTVYFEVSAQYHNPAYGSFPVTVKRSPTAVVTVSPTSLRYTRKEQGPTVTAQHGHETADSVNRATEVGTYAVKATPDENYAWSDGGTEARTFGWSIVDSLYTVQFDANGGEGTMASKTLAYDEEYVVPECDFTKTGCEFQRWQVLIDSRAVTNYTAGVVVSNLTSVAGKTVTFKAEWTSYYTIAFDGNGATNTVMATQLVERDVTTNLTENAYARPGYTFLGWDDLLNSKRYEDGAAVRNIADVGATNTLKAAWSTNSYTVVFFGNGGTNTMESQGFAYDIPRNLRPNAFIRTGYTFDGWALDPLGDVAFTNRQEVSNLSTEDKGVIALYARWRSTGSLVNPYSIAADCDKTDATGVALELTPEVDCSIVTNRNLAFEGGNDQYIQLLPVSSGLNAHAILRATLNGKGVLTFQYKIVFPDDDYIDAGDNFYFIPGSGSALTAHTANAWTQHTYIKDTEGAEEVQFDMQVQYGVDGDYALVDFIKWDPQPRDLGTVGVTFRDADGGVFSNLTVKAGKAIGVLPVLTDVDGEACTWTSQGAVVSPSWIVPPLADGVEVVPEKDTYALGFMVPQSLAVPEKMRCFGGKVYRLPDLPSGYKWRRLDAGGRLYDGGLLVFNLAKQTLLLFEAVQVP